MSADTSERFVHEIPLRDPSRGVERVLLTRLETARLAYNAFVTELLRRDALMRESIEYRHLCGEIRASKGRRSLPSTCPAVISFASARDRAAAWSALRKRFGLEGSYALSTFVPVIARRFEPRTGANRLHTTMLHELASRAWDAYEPYLLGKRSGPGRRGKPRRRSFRDPLTVISTRSTEKNHGPLRFVGNAVEWSDVRRAKDAVSLRAVIDPKDDVARYALSRCDGNPITAPFNVAKREDLDCMLQHRIAQLRVGYRVIRGKRRWFAQLVLEGVPYRKLRALFDAADVGVDVGARHIAIVSPDAAHAAIVPLNLNVVRALAQERVVERRRARAQDRSRRATNPEAFGERGRYKPGAKIRVRSKRFQNLGRQRRESARRVTETKRQQANALANSVVALGRNIHLERLSYRAWQASGMGRSVAACTPGALSVALERAARKYHRQIVWIDAGRARLSQLCHVCGSYTKDLIRGPIRLRMSTCSCGRESVQRDLYSAFLASFCDAEGSFDATRAQSAWASMSKCLAVAAPNEKQPASTGLVPSLERFLRTHKSELVATEITRNADAGVLEVAAIAQAVVCEAARDHRHHSIEQPGNARGVQGRSTVNSCGDVDAVAPALDGRRRECEAARNAQP